MAATGTALPVRDSDVWVLLGSGAVARSFEHHYRDFYRKDAEFERWRDLGASDKFANIQSLWGRYGSPDHPSVVDIGCGNGAIAVHAARAGFARRYVGYDISESGIERADQRGLDDVQFHVFGGRVPEADHTYDLAVLSHVVEHVEEPRTVLREAQRVANYVVVEVPLEHTVRHSGDYRWTDVGHVNFYDLTLIRQLMQSCGITVLGELLTSPSESWMRETGGRSVQARWHVKQAALRITPRVASGVFTYHATLIGRSLDG